MTYKDIMSQAQTAFDPEGRGIITGRPVEVLFCISREADDRGWERQVNVSALQDRLRGNANLDKGSVAVVVDMMNGRRA